jgi:ornithine cyclodeaminase
MNFYTREQIERAIDIPAILQAIEEGLLLSSQGKVSLAPVSMLDFKSPPGEVHIKSASLDGDRNYVVKIAAGFPLNSKLGLSASQGLMLLFASKTGRLETILHDEGYLTDLRTGIAGAICAKHFAPKKIDCIGIVGTGNQAVMQLDCLRTVTDCRNVIAWGRNPQNLKAFAENPRLEGFQIQTTTDLSTLCSACGLIITATRSEKPLIFAKHLRPGMHITAVGADQRGKQEISEDAMQKADKILVDNLEQCLQFGDLSYAKDLIPLSKVQEIGAALSSFKRDPLAITIADLTGVAIEDLQIAKAIAHKLEVAC